MNLSVFDMFKIGIGPSSSHTVGPMRAARRFAVGLTADERTRTARVRAELFGSLAFTGKGHGSDRAIVVGLEGEQPEVVDPELLPRRFEEAERTGTLALFLGPTVAFQPKEDLVFHRRETLPLHSNGMRFTALDVRGEKVAERIFYSVGGGFVVHEDGTPETVAGPPMASGADGGGHPFDTGEQLLEHCVKSGLSVSALMMENERALRDEPSVRSGLSRLWEAMESCIRRGCEREGILPGGLKVKRRATALYRKLKAAGGGDALNQNFGGARALADPLMVMDWVNLFALAVNEENAAGGRVVTAPTNGAAGIIPAVLQYYRRFTPDADEQGIHRFLLTAAAIGILYKKNASLSGAEVGCQGEVGVACSMAAGALAEVLGGTPEQVENAAEIGMEHNLGLTCDPIGGLVQVPCIERNAMGAVKAINAARLALSGDGKHKVSLDKVIATMRQTGADMSSKYKETARGGLAVNIIEC
jgi:L-serine dehydratase